MSQYRNYAYAAFLGAFFAIFGASATIAQEGCEKGASKSGTITGSAKSVGFIAGAKWGTGTLTLTDGRTFKFNFKGIKLLSTGISTVEFTGEVYNLEKIEDFIGVYYGAATGMKAIVSVGPGEFVANNSKCVLIKAKAKGKGIELSPPGPAGFYVQLVN